MEHLVLFRFHIFLLLPLPYEFLDQDKSVY